MSLADTPDLHAGEDTLHVHDRFVWTQPDGAAVFMRVTRINRSDGVAWLRCSRGGRSWTRRHQLPLFPSMARREWTVAELLETIS